MYLSRASGLCNPAKYAYRRCPNVSWNNAKNTLTVAHKQAQAVYKKTGGAWLLQTDVATIKSEIQNGKLKIG